MPLLLILLKLTLLLALALGLTLVMQRASAGSRHLVWLVALAGLFALPVLAAWSPLRLRVLPASLTSAYMSVSHSRQPDQTVSAPPADPDPVAGAIPSEPAAGGSTAAAQRLSVVGWLAGHAGGTLLLVWTTIAALLAAWLAYGAWSVRRIVRRAAPLIGPDWQRPLYEIADRLGLATAPALMRSTDVKMPFACGVVHSAIVLPAECDGWSADRRSAVLIHELGHVRRHDLIGHTLGRLACAVYWFHPMVWSAARRLRAESERACDDLALRFGARPSDYAEHLLDIVTCVRDHATPSVALALAHRKEFEGRMLAILDPQLRRSAAGRIQSLSLAGALAVVTVVISAAAPASAPTESHSPAQLRTEAAVAPGSGPADSIAQRSGVAGSVHSETGADLRTNTRLSYALRHSLYDAGDRRYSAVDSMLSSDTAARVALLIQMLRSDSSAAVRRIAAWGLNQYFDGTNVRKALASALTGDADSEVREMAAWALADADGDDVTALTSAAVSDHAPAVRETATWDLGSRAQPATEATLVLILAHDTTTEVRATAAWALGQFDLTSAPKPLLAALADPSQDVRMKAAWAVSQIGDSLALPQIRAALRGEKAPDVQRAQLRALIRSGEDPEKMVEWLKSNNAGVRQMAARALAGGEASEPWPWPWPRPRPQP